MLGSCGKASKEEKCQEGCLIEHFYSSLNHVCYELTYPRWIVLFNKIVPILSQLSHYHLHGPLSLLGWWKSSERSDSCFVRCLVGAEFIFAESLDPHPLELFGSWRRMIPVPTLKLRCLPFARFIDSQRRRWNYETLWNDTQSCSL